MNILIAGGSGFVGKKLAEHLKGEDHQLTLLTRQNKSNFLNYDAVITWEELSNIENNFDVIVNLCGYGISEKKWSEEIKRKLIDSRTIPTKKLTNYIGDSNTKLINASAIGYYAFSDSRQTESDYIHDQKSFSHEIVSKWELAVTDSKIRNYHLLRFGVVLGNGGMIQKLLPTAKFGLGALVGDGNQLISWIHILDLCQVIELCANSEISDKVINVTTPEATSQKHLIDGLCKNLGRPRLLKLPTVFIKSMFGQMGEELLLSSQNIYPERLLNTGYQFKFPDIESALSEIIKK